MKKHQITIVPTKHPSIVKFESTAFISPNKNYEFNNIDEAVNSPLAKQLFFLPFVKAVYLSSTFIGIQKFDMVEWEDVQEEVKEQLEDYLNSGEPVVVEESPAKQAITVYIENTPNPATMKFVANKPIVPSVFEYKNIDEAKEAPLAKELFMLPYVKEIFMDVNYISITKFDIANWEDVTTELRELIREFISSGKQAVEEAAKQKAVDQMDDISKQIFEIIDKEVKPAVASDGGNIVFSNYDTESKVVSVILQGACSGCPSSTITLKNGIEGMLKNILGDQVSEVVAING
jgi:Fe-S cluster biogenesis protein NfuA